MVKTIPSIDFSVYKLFCIARELKPCDIKSLQAYIKIVHRQ